MSCPVLSCPVLSCLGLAALMFICIIIPLDSFALLTMQLYTHHPTHHRGLNSLYLCLLITECDTWASLKQPPPETLIFNMVVVLFVQGFANSASRHSVVLGWIISIITTNVSLFLLESDAYFWINVEYLMLLCVSYEFERHTLRHFIKVTCCCYSMQCLHCKVVRCVELCGVVSCGVES